MYPKITNYIKEAEKGFEAIPEERKLTLAKISKYIAGRIKANQKVELIYICTHNSRRSHFGQIWAKTAASYYGFEDVTTYSGGTEATSFNPNAITAVLSAGFKIEKDNSSVNPMYTVHFQETGDTILCFSKKYNDAANPQNGFCAIMTCTEADGACPFVLGTVERVSTPYDDPKAFDNTHEQDAKYSERCLQIATETLYAFSLVKNLI
ncbi:MAG: protein-tyrosine-phosphatase [Opitutaceae bacterium]|nr:protein-tyrosine-phosphatase [Cytophagales bacterium]